MAEEDIARIPAGSDAALAEYIRAERLRFVLIQSKLPIIFSPVAALILSVTLWNTVEAMRLMVFTGGLLLIAVQRVLATRMFPRPVPSGSALRRWEWIYIGSIMLVDLWWGIGALFLIVPGAGTESAIVFAFVMLMAGGHTASYSVHGPTVVLGVLALALPITIAFALQPDTFHRALAFVALMFIAASFRSVRTLRYFFGRTYRLAYDLQQARDRAERLASIDMLTELINRRAFYEIGETELARHARSGESLALLMIDIDYFKSINDRYGHGGGDAAIRALADVVRTQLRAGDIAGRLGGEEFAVLMPGAVLDEATQVAQRLAERVASTQTPYEGQVISYTLSIGVAQWQPGESLDALVARADDALYRAKRGGRNRVEEAALADG